MYERGAVRSSAGSVEFAFTSRAEGDFAIGGPSGELAQRRAATAPGEWTWLEQVHGAGGVVAHDDDVRPHGIQRHGGIDECFAFFDR